MKNTYIFDFHAKTLPGVNTPAGFRETTGTFLPAL